MRKCTFGIECIQAEKIMHKLGDKFDTYTFTQYLGKSIWLLTCNCGRTRKVHSSNLWRTVCCCQKLVRVRGRTRSSGLKYENSLQRIQELQEKYKNGVPEGEVERWFGLIN